MRAIHIGCCQCCLLIGIVEKIAFAWSLSIGIIACVVVWTIPITILVYDRIVATASCYRVLSINWMWATEWFRLKYTNWNYLSNSSGCCLLIGITCAYTIDFGCCLLIGIAQPNNFEWYPLITIVQPIEFESGLLLKIVQPKDFEYDLLNWLRRLSMNINWICPDVISNNSKQYSSILHRTNDS